MITWSTTIGAAAASLLALATGALAQAAPKPNLVAPGKLTYGTAATFAPFEYQENGKLTGLDIELGAEIAKAMGLEPAPLNIEFKGLIPALQGSRIDAINSAMYINPERSQQVDFVPYMRIGNEILVPKGNPRKITGRRDLCGLRVAVTLGGIQETYARQDDAACKGAGKAGVEVLTFPTHQDSVLATRQGRADAFFDSTPGATMILKETGAFERAGDTFEANTQIGWAVRKGDAAMKVALEAAMKAAVANGTYAALIKKYELPASVALF
jgi:polar amino acid transport system substrate-binding protein